MIFAALCIYVDNMRAIWYSRPISRETERERESIFSFSSATPLSAFFTGI